MGPRYRFGQFVVEPFERRLLRDGVPVPLPDKVFETLLVLVRNAGRLLTKEELMAAVWPDTAVEENNLNHNISVIRRALGEGEFIQTVPRRGYRFVAAIDTSATAPRRWRASRLRKLVAPLAASAAVIIAVIASPLGSHHGRSSSDSIRSVCVVPFQLLGGGSDDAYLAASVSETLKTRLGTIPRLLVRAAGASPDPIQAGQKLGVDAVVNGSVQPHAGGLRINAQIVDVRGRAIIWSRSYDGTLGELVIIEDALATNAGDKLCPGLTDEQRARLTPPQSVDAIANDEYLRGRDLLDRRHAVSESLPHFERAVARDPNFALAWAGFAEALAVPAGTRTSPNIERAEDAARRAIRLDPSLAEGHAVLGFVDLFHKWQFDAAERQLRFALRMNPGSARFHDWYALVLMTHGNLDGAIREAERAHEIDPLSSDIAADVALMLLVARDYSRAELAARAALALDPSAAKQYLIESLLMQHRTREALAEIASSEPSGSTLSERDVILAGEGDADARQRVAGEIATSPDLTPDGRANLYAAIGDREGAMHWLERAYRLRAFGLIFAGVAPEFDGLRDDPRFRDLIRRIGVVERVPKSQA